MTGDFRSTQRFRRPKPQENHEVATERAFERLRDQSPEQLQWLGAAACGNDWRLPVLNEVFEVRGSSKTVVTSDGREVGPAWRILALHYLAVAVRPDRVAPRITFDDLPTARSYGDVYRSRVIGRLCATVGRQKETLCQAAGSLGGRAVDGGDIAYNFDVFPRVEVCLIWHAADEEFPASATLLLPENIEAFFCPEDIVVLSEGVVARLADKPF
jgi:hypothetical protein